MHILLGLIVMAAGICMIAYSSSLTDTFGRWPWADNHLGGTTQGFILIGFVIIIISMFVMFGQGESISTDVTQGIPTTTSK